MTNTLRKLPLILAFAATILFASCTEDSIIEPTRTEDDKGAPPPPPPPGP